MPTSAPFLSLSVSLLVVACGNAGDARDKASNPAAAGKTAALPTVSAAQLLERAKPLFGALPKLAASKANPVTDAKVELGRMLYYDPRLSKNHDVSCNTCHELSAYGVDTRGTPTSGGHRGQIGDRNSPTVYNAAIQASQFWDGRAATVEAQAKGPILNPVEMAMPSEEATVKVIKSIPGYAEKFSAAFPDREDPISYDNIANAIAAFERKLMTPSAFDDFMKGDMGALSELQIQGLALFMDVGCATCHTGPGLGGTMFQKLGSVKPWETKDEGRSKITNVEADKFTFKVPILRNIERTGPYLHDGSIDSLEEIVQKMSEHQTAKGTLSDREMGAILAFLGTLTGKIPEDLIHKPDLPKNGPDTPAPDPA